ncbi:MAG: alpha/beta hydrolase, partial [Burkholderiaceae bacterium]
APTLLLWGEEDQMIPSRNAQDYERDIPRSTTVLLPQSGHLIQEERPDVGLTAVSYFIDKHLPQ